MTRNKPDDRSDNVRKLQEMIEDTYENIAEARDALDDSDDEERRRIEEKNQRRIESINHYRAEISDEVAYQRSKGNGQDKEED